MAQGTSWAVAATQAYCHGFAGIQDPFFIQEMFGFRIKSRPSEIRCSFRLTALYTFALHFYFCKKTFTTCSAQAGRRSPTPRQPRAFSKKSSEMSQLINSFKLRPIFGTPMQEWDVRRIIELLTKGGECSRRNFAAASSFNLVSRIPSGDHPLKLERYRED